MAFLQLFIVVALCVLLGSSANAAQRLQSYNVDPASVTVSGISSGGAMASNFHFAYSSQVHGAGIFASVPYMCGFHGVVAATTCMTTPSLVNMGLLITEVNALALQGKIDATHNLQGDPVFVYHGTRDTVVYPASGGNVQEMYQHFGANVITKFDLAAHHGQPTHNYGAACGSSSSGHSYINNCGYKGAFHMLNYLYGGALTEPNDSLVPSGDFIEFDQSEFFSLHPSLSSMDTSGFVYVPSNCRSGAVRCRLHIAFHGCGQQKGAVGDTYATKTGYMEAAEVNNIIVLFPQTVMTLANPQGCWDWWGYLNAFFPTRDGNQVLATYRMMTRVIRG